MDAPTWASISATASVSLSHSTVAAAFEAFIARPQGAAYDGAFPEDDGWRYPHLPSDTSDILRSLSSKRSAGVSSEACGADGESEPNGNALSQSDINAAAADAALLGEHCRHPMGNLLPLLIPHAVVSHDVARYLSHRLPAQPMDGPGIDTAPWLASLDLRLLQKQSALALPSEADHVAVLKVLIPHLPELLAIDAAVSYDCCEVAERLSEALCQAPPSLGVCINGDLSRGTVPQLRPIADRLVSLDLDDRSIDERDTLFLERLPRLRAVRASVALSGSPVNYRPSHQRRPQAVLSASLNQHSHDFLSELPCLLTLSVKRSVRVRPFVEGKSDLPTVLRSSSSLTRLELSTVSLDDDTVRSLFGLRRLRQLNLNSVDFPAPLLQCDGPGALTSREVAAGFASLEVLELVWCEEAPSLSAAVPSLTKLQVCCITRSSNTVPLLVFSSEDRGCPAFPALTSLDIVDQSLNNGSQWEDLLAIPTLAELRCHAFCDQLPLLDRGAWEAAWVALHNTACAPVRSAHSSLRRLHLTDVDEGMLDHVARLPHLEELDVSASDNLTARSFFALEDMHSLRILNVAETAFDSAGFAAAASLPRLWCLNVRETRVTLEVVLQTMEASEDHGRVIPFPSLRVLVVEGLRDDDDIKEWAAGHRPGIDVVV